MSFDVYTFGVRLQDCRRQEHLSQDELAQRVDVDKQHISRMERGINACSLEVLSRLSRELHVSSDFLLTGEPDRKDSLRARVGEVIAQLTEIQEAI